MLQMKRVMKKRDNVTSGHEMSRDITHSLKSSFSVLKMKRFAPNPNHNPSSMNDEVVITKK